MNKTFFSICRSCLIIIINVIDLDLVLVHVHQQTNENHNKDDQKIMIDELIPMNDIIIQVNIFLQNHKNYFFYFYLVQSNRQYNYHPSDLTVSIDEIINHAEEHPPIVQALIRELLLEQ